MEVIEKEINSFIQENKKYMFTKEYEITTDTKRKIILEQVLNVNENKIDIVISDKKDETPMNSFFEQIDKAEIMKPWNRLRQKYQVVKINEYVTEKYTDDKILALETLMKMHSEGLLNKKEVDYNVTDAKINNIPNFKKVDSKFILEKVVLKKAVRKTAIKKKLV